MDSPSFCILLPRLKASSFSFCSCSLFSQLDLSFSSFLFSFPVFSSWLELFSQLHLSSKPLDPRFRPIPIHSLGPRRYGELLAIYILCVNGCARRLFCHEPNSWGPQWVSLASRMDQCLRLFLYHWHFPLAIYIHGTAQQT